jgi:hypothetical protein
MKRYGLVIRVILLSALLSALPVGAAKYFKVYLTNGTKYYLDIWSESYTYAYLPPGGDLLIETAAEEINVYVYFSAGQGITKVIRRTYETSYPKNRYFGTDCDGRRTCYGEGGGCIGKNVLEIEDGYDTEAHWTITWEDFFPPGNGNDSTNPVNG